MRTLLLLTTLVLAGALSAQTSVALRIDHKAGQAEFDNAGPWTTPMGEEVYIDRLEYYMSMFTLVHDGGQETPIDGAYVLADGFVDELHPLGEVSGVDNVEALKFFVGIDPDNNHADPAAWPSDHPLAPQVPSMHWGWASGYRFVALEGGAGINGVIAHEIHALGDDNHFPGEMGVLATIENGVLVLDVEADVFGFYNLLSVGAGLINHGEEAEAILVCNNLADKVFRLPGAADVADAAAMGLDFALIPVEGGAEIRFDAPLSSPADIVLLDILGRPVHQERWMAGTQRQRLADVPQGAFLLSVLTDRDRTTRRWVQGR